MKNISPAFRMLLSGKESPCNASEAGDVGSIRGSEWSPGVGNGNLLHYSCLEKRHEQRSLVGDTELSDWTTTVKHIHYVFHYRSVQFSSVTHSCPTLCNPMDCSTPGFPVHHQFLELAQTHVHRVGDAIQPSHPLSSPSSTPFNLSHIRVFSNGSVLHIRWPKLVTGDAKSRNLMCILVQWSDLSHCKIWR